MTVTTDRATRPRLPTRDATRSPAACSRAVLGTPRAAGRLPRRPARPVPGPGRRRSGHRAELAERAGIDAALRPRVARAAGRRRRSSTSTTSAPRPTPAATAAGRPRRGPHRPGEPGPRRRRWPGSSSAPRRRCPTCSRRTAPAAASTGRTTVRMSSRPRRPSTDRSSTTWSATGSARCRTSPHGSPPASGRVADVGLRHRLVRRSPSPGRSRVSQVDGIDIDAGSIDRARTQRRGARA